MLVRRWSGRWIGLGGLLALLLTACGGDNATAPMGPGSPSGQLSEAERAAVMRATEARFDELRSGPNAWDIDYVLSQMEAFLNARPEVAWATYDPQYGVVTGNYLDGISLAVLFNRFGPVERALDEQADDGELPQTRASRAELPGPDGARLMRALGPYYGTGANAEIGQMLSAKGYTINNAPSTVDGLRTVSGDGITYFNTHGGPVAPAGLDSDTADRILGVWTASPVPSSMPQDLLDMCYAGELVTLTADHGVDADGNPVAATHFGITAKFVQNYMSFGDNNLFVLANCYAGNENFAAFRNACFNQGVEIFASWTNLSSGTATYRYLFDRLLGADQFRPESPPQRPFGWQQVYADLEEQGLTELTLSNFGLIGLPGLPLPEELGGTAAHFVYYTNGDLERVAPTISYLEVDEPQSVLKIHGSFGDTQGTVEVDGVGGTIQSWTDNLVMAQIPYEGAGSSGDVVVKVGAKESNPVPLTEWHGTVRQVFDPNEGSLRSTFELDVRFRADVHSYRTEPGGVPQYRTVGLHASRASSATFTAQGSKTTTDSDGDTATVEWSGQQDLELVEDPFGGIAQQRQFGSGNASFWVVGNLDVETRALKIVFGATATYTQDSYRNGALIESQQLPQDLYSIPPFTTALIQGAIPAFSPNVGSNFTIAGDTVGDDVADGEVQITWSSFPASPTPDSETDRGRIARR